MEKYNIEDFRKIIKTLRSPDGCPWDRVQTHESMRSCLIEECYEVLEAINNKDDDNLKEELGDVLMQVVMHSRIAEERGSFTFDDVVQGISEKMIRRHPHVFGNEAGEVVEAASVDWDKIKQEEKRNTSRADMGPLTGIPKSLPALIRAQKVLKKSDKIYKDGKTALESIEDIQKSLEELKDSVLINSEKSLENKHNSNKIGAIILEIVNIAGELQENAENSLTNMVETFINKRESNED
ncbi:MAG: nucleoside triphosphate pyrophosphohydrolase [Lachnospiraceae bacterium]|nr:nucleoside triphosphate pyrophosphohydrolase [Lachnospiraceae bacterium]